MREEIRIESGIPYPRLDGRHYTGGSGPPLVYPWDKLKIGDSFAVTKRNTVRAAMSWARRHGRGFISKQEHQPPYLYRVWRVK